MRCVRTANKVGTGSVGGPAEVARLNDRYRLVRRIGEGASSEVFLADDVVAGCSCAVKLYAQGGEAESRRLLTEFSRLAELRHRNIVEVFDVSSPVTADGPRASTQTTSALRGHPRSVVGTSRRPVAFAL